MTHDPMKSAAADAAANAAAYSARHTYALGYEAGVRSTDADEARLGHTLMLLDEARETIEHIRTEGAKALEDATAALVEAQKRIDELEARNRTGVSRHDAAKDCAEWVEHVANGLGYYYDYDGPFVAAPSNEVVENIRKERERLTAAESRIAVEASRADVAEADLRDRCADSVANMKRADAAIRARDEVGIQLVAAQAEIARLYKGLRNVERFMLAEWRPPAEAVLAMVRDVAAGGPSVPGDALAPVKEARFVAGCDVFTDEEHKARAVTTWAATGDGPLWFVEDTATDSMCLVGGESMARRIAALLNGDTLAPVGTMNGVPIYVDPTLPNDGSIGSIVVPTSPAGASAQPSGCTPVASSATSSVLGVEGKASGPSGIHDTEDPAAGLLAASGIDVKGVAW